MKRLTDKKGFALILTLPVLCLIIFICTTLLVICGNDILPAYSKCEDMRAYCVADAGIADGFFQLRGAGVPPTLVSFSKTYNINGANDSGSYTVEYAQQSAGEWPSYTITSTGIYKGSTKILRMTVQLTSFQHWAYISATETCKYPGFVGVPSYWVTGNIVNGPLQVNDKLYVAGNPIFNGSVSVVDTKVTYYSAPGVDKPQFNSGLFLGAKPVPLPDPTPLLTAIKSDASQPQGLLIDGRDMTNPSSPKPGYYRDGPGGKKKTNTHIEFLANGTMNVQNNNQYQTLTNMPIPSNGAIYVTGGEVDVKGVLNGQATIGCDENIWTSGNIIYHDTSPCNPNLNSTDVLGLVASKNVIFPNDLGVGNKEIDAYIVALKGSFYLENIMSVPGVLGNLVQYGGVMSEWSATVFGCFSGAGVLQMGYLQIPYYDSRLVGLVPPCFTPARDSTGVKYRRVLMEEL